MYIENQPFRKTTQPLLPLKKEIGEGYTVFPTINTANKIETGYENLAKKLANERTIIIDGFGGVQWEMLRGKLITAFSSIGKTSSWIDVGDYLKAEGVIEDLITPSLGDLTSIFGKRFDGNLIDFFNAETLSNIQYGDENIHVFYGVGASLCNIKGKLIYVDVPKNEIQYRMRAGAMQPLGATKETSYAQTYKRLYFIDWPVLNKHKDQLLPKIDFIIDEQRVDEITWMQGDDFRATLDEVLAQPFRARPWFEAGIWGGDWMKKKLNGLNKEEINYAWSFELITPENGIVFENDGFLLEVSFDYLLFRNAEKLLGLAAKRFKKEFPIRFDFLDTFNGGNLSVQCHPSTSYTNTHFGEHFTQDETYYILDCEDDAVVYLGFQENIDPEEFKVAMRKTEKGEAFEVEKYVQKHQANKHDLFLIPNQTIHASGKNNLVLEISSTPYIFTFKLYDWQRLDLNGKPRPINLEHGFKNLNFERKGEVVDQTLISKPIVLASWPTGRKLKLPTHGEHFYEIDRYEFTGEIEIETHYQCHIGMLVEGLAIAIETDGKEHQFNFCETFVIPASIEKYKLINNSGQKAYVVIAYVKESCC